MSLGASNFAAQSRIFSTLVPNCDISDLREEASKYRLFLGAPKGNQRHTLFCASERGVSKQGDHKIGVKTCWFSLCSRFGGIRISF